MKRLSDTFITVDQSGNQHIMYEYQQYEIVTYISGRTENSPGLKEYWCEGRLVILTSDTTFKLSDGKTEVKKVA